MRASNDFTLRACRYRDLNHILALEEVAFADSPYSRPDFIYLLRRARDGFMIAEEDGRLLGYVIAVGEGGVGMIQSIAVSPEFRKKGVGEVLMKSAVDHLAKYEQICLLVDTNNMAAISLYYKFSFEETGRIIKGYYRNGDDAVEMVRTKAAPGNQSG
jgi:ribosomal-protein-alanine N-acetyltransferase